MTGAAIALFVAAAVIFVVARVRQRRGHNDDVLGRRGLDIIALGVAIAGLLVLARL